MASIRNLFTFERKRSILLGKTIQVGKLWLQKRNCTISLIIIPFSSQNKKIIIIIIIIIIIPFKLK